VSLAASADGDRPNGPRSRKGAKTRARLLDAAKEIFEENGFLDARISDIADRAGLSHGSFYHYFDSKEEIFREIAAAVDERLSAPLSAVILDPNSHAAPRERIHEALRLYFESYREEARIMGVIEQVSRYDEEVGALRRSRTRHYADQIAQSISQMQVRGLADPKLDPTVAAAALGTMTIRFAESWLVEGTVDCTFEDAVQQLTLIFVNAMQPGSPTGERSRRGAATR
jgi:AcrR family transcriptional regulator